MAAAHREALRRHCHRMLGSLEDADDAVQETLLAAWRGRDAFEGRASDRTWLYRIATNRCLNAIRDGARRPPPAPAPPFEAPAPTSWDDATWLQPYPDAPDAVPEVPGARIDGHEAVGPAFARLMQRLPPVQMAMLLLCDVLGFSRTEAGDMIGRSPAAAKALLQRARAAVAAARRDDPGWTRGPEDSTDAEVAHRFAAAFVGDDIDGMLALLTDDAWLRMPPAPHAYRGRAAVGAFLRASSRARRGGREVLMPARSGGRTAFAWYHGPRDGEAPRFAALVVPVVRAGRVRELTRFHVPGLAAAFGLPGELAPTP